MADNTLPPTTAASSSAHPVGSTEIGAPDSSSAEAGASPLPTSGRFLAWRLFFIAILVAFLGLLAWQLYRTNVFEQRADGIAPPINFTTFEGEEIRWDDLRGKGIVVNFWASWCDPCREEADLLEATWRREQANGIVFLGMDYLDQEPAALAFLAEYDITYPNGPDLRSEAARRYGIKGVPETYFIDPEGRIVGSVIGPVVDVQQMESLIDQIRP